MRITEEKIKILEENCLSARALLSSSLKHFISVFHYYIYKTEFCFKPFHLDIINTLETMVFNPEKTKKNLIINIAPRFGKSKIVEYFIAWGYCVNKNCNNIYTSYSDALVRKFSGEIMQVMSSPLYQNIFGIEISADSKSKSLWKIVDGGEMRATSMGGSITGFGAGLASGEWGGAIIVDDPLKADEARSSVKKEHSIEYFRDTLSTRKNSNNTPTIIIMQRLAVDDLVGFLKKNNPNDYNVLEVKALDENNLSIWEERLSTENLLKMREENPSLFYAQYQQTPRIDGGNLFKDNMFIRGPLPNDFDFTFITCDTAYKEKEDNDYTVAGYFGVRSFNDGTKRLYLLDVFRNKIKASDCEAYLVPFFQKCNRENFIGCLVEPKGHGIYLNQKMSSYGIPMQSEDFIDEFYKDRRMDKVARANVVIPTLNTFPIIASEEVEEKVFNEIKQELLDFPKGAHDDSVDCIIDAVKFAYNRPLSILDVV